MGFAIMLLAYSVLAFSGGEQGLTKENINDFDSNGWTPLMSFVNERVSRNADARMKELQALFDLGADPNIRSKNDRNDTAYTLILQPGMNTRVVSALVKNGADVNQFDGRGQIDFHRYVKKPELLETILKAGLNPNGSGSKTSNRTFLQDAIAEENYDAVKLLLQYGADPNEAKERALSPLYRSFKIPDLRYMTILIEHGASIHGNKSISGSLTKKNNKAIIELLIAKGADVSEVDENGNTPLHYAYLHLKRGKDMLPVIEFLMLKGANMKIKNKAGQLPNEMKLRRK